jgi:hypothetical protein
MRQIDHNRTAIGFSSRNDAKARMGKDVVQAAVRQHELHRKRRVSLVNMPAPSVIEQDSSPEDSTTE